MSQYYSASMKMKRYIKELDKFWYDRYHTLITHLKDKKGFNWNNMMLQRWIDHEGNEHRVLDDYNRNVVLCDLKAQPGNIRSIINDVVEDSMEPKKVSQVGLHLMKFCAKHDMQRIADNVQTYAEALNAKYV